MKWSIPEKVIERGRDYLKEGRVLSVTPDPENKVWHAEVLGSELYRVELDATAKEEDFCQCPYWEEHHYCKHTIAVELYLRQQGKSRMIQTSDLPKKAAFSASEMFANGFSRLHTEEKKSKPLTVEFQLEVLATNPYHHELSVIGIAARIGYQETKRTYVVKNIYKFLQAVQDQKKILINKQYSFQLSAEAFSPEINDLLNLLAEIAQTQQLIGQTGIQVKGKLDKKYLLLPVAFAKELILKMQAAPTTLLIEDKKIQSLTFSEETHPLSFSVVKKEDLFDLTIHKDFQYVLNHYHWGIIDNVIYPLTAEQMEIYETLNQLLKRLEKPVISYKKAELSTLFTQVIPPLKKIGEVAIDSAVTDKISEAPLTIVYTLRKKKGQIALQADFHYGEVVFSSDPAHNVFPEGHPEILRDIQKEKRSRHLLQQLQFAETETGWSKPLPAGAELYRFFTGDIPLLRRMGEVRLGKKLRELYLDAGKHRPQIEVSEEGSWLDVRFDISGIAEHEVDAILESLLQQDQFYTLENGQVLSLESEEFQQTSLILQKFRENAHAKNGVVQIPRHQGLLLRDQLADTEATFSVSFQQMAADLTHPENYQSALPKDLHATLREYQMIGFRWLKMLSHYHFGGILADEMGLGKTLQTITYLLSEKQEQGQIQVLIVAPASLTYNWQQEIKRFAPDLQAQVVSGNRHEREMLIEEKADIFITSYASMRQDIDRYQDKELEYLILDEAQMVKNSSTKTAQALRSLKVPHRFALSGTPIENNLNELWSLFQMIMPGFFPNRLAFREMQAEEIAKMIKPFILRRDKNTVLQDLPEKIETNYYSVLTEDQKRIYLAYLRQMQEQITQMDAATFKKNRISILAGLTRLRQICCDPKLFLDDYEGTSGKLEQVKDLITAAKDNDRRILLFSQFTGMLTIIEEELNQMGLECFYLRGSTPPKERIKMVEAFNRGEKDVFLISLKAGGTGLNLTGADTVILYDLWWNPAVEEQAAARAHRIGQKKVVEVWRMIAEGTIEERMDSLQNEKRELFQKVIQGNEAQLRQMTEEDIRMILSIGE
ncbi:DEAD/DEAH box helicase [Enterococcus mediterraneensis]|uniref:DEAD/DEAH box helicase n=1 Tax=Enterococcus mediterraneensis TaxID=2364791 RepID=UPI000F061035|nr:DEAD/DEAH box helicase [Enterococcus mediterraneensis]